MNILVILNDLDIGGSQNYTIGLMNEFVKLGHRVSLRVLSGNLPLEERLSHEIEMKVWKRKNKLDFTVLKNIRKEIKHGKYNGVISSYPLYQKLATVLLEAELITIYPVHTTIERSRNSFFLNFILYRLKKKNDIYLTSIDSQTNYMAIAFKLGNKFFRQIYNGIDSEKFILPPVGFDKIRFLQSVGIDPKHLIILMVAGYRSEKRHIDAIKAFIMLQKEMDLISLVCVGDNRIKERDELQKLVDRGHIENVKLLPASEAGDVRDYYWSSDLFTLTSNKVETFPISVLEAMACGLPCVLTDTGGARNIIKSPVYGRVVPAEDPVAIANAWKDVLSRKDEGSKSEIREYIVSNFSLKNSAVQYLNLMKHRNADQ